MPRACWEARTSGGASSAACPPASTTCAMARRATTVFPEPTSPWRRRCIGWWRANPEGPPSPTSRWPSPGSKGDDGLPGAHLAVEEAVDRLGGVDVGGELPPHLALALGELEGQRGVDRVEQAAGAARAGSAGFEGSGAATGGQGELQHQCL